MSHLYTRKFYGKHFINALPVFMFAKRIEKLKIINTKKTPE